MQNTTRKKIEKLRSTKDDLVKDEPPLSSRTMQEVKKGVSTPRNYLQKTTPSDIYGKKKPNVLQAPKKSSPATSSRNARNVSPMKDFLRSTPSSVSHASTRSSSKVTPDRKSEANAVGLSARKGTPRVVKAQAPSSVTVNSPMIKRKLNLTKEKSNISIKSKISDTTKNVTSENAGKGMTNMAEIFTRQRSKTRTLDENEVKVFKPDVVDNNAEMKNLSRKLSAKPKSFYVDLNGEPKAEKDKSSEEEVSYEDDFESYESDFDSYHSESHSSQDSNATDEERSPEDIDNDPKYENEIQSTGGINAKDVKDEEKMLDSGSYDLRETQRSAQKNKPAMLDFILEGAEEAEKRASLTDEGFQDMSTSSAVSSIKTLHIDILDRPLFIDFTSSKNNRRKRRIFERLRRRAEDILSMVTLHEMKFTLFEMKPVSYDTYMAAFGRSNCAQVSVQTLEDAVTVEVQTDDVSCDTKWTQCPVKFSKYDVSLTSDKTNTDFKEDLARRFTVLLNPMKAVCDETGEESYGIDPMRIYIEQKSGVGPDKIQPNNVYMAKLKSVDFNVKRLKKFLNRAESRISRILSMNAGNPDMSGAVKTTKLPFSKSYVTVPIDKANSSFSKDLKVTNVFISETKSHFIISVHENSSSNSSAPKCILCLWDLSLTLQKPLKMLVATDNVAIGKYRGGADGIVVASLIDGTVHLWDLSERAAWMHDNSLKETVNASAEVLTEKLTHNELDREWNRVHGNTSLNKEDICFMQSSAYTSSGANVVKNDPCDRVVGLEFLGETQVNSIQDGERKIVAQICTLQRTGILTMWSVVQDRQKYSSKDIGKAFWSKLVLEKVQTLDLSERLKLCMQSSNACLKDTNLFDLNAAKNRITAKWRQKQTSFSSDRMSADVARPRSARKRVLPLQEVFQNNWETGLVCYDLRILRMEGADNFLIAKNCGEVLSCSRYAGVFKINRFVIASDTSPITCLQVSQNGLPFFLAATDTGTVNLCSMQDLRVLLTLDIRNTSSSTTEKYNSDAKGRYVGSTTKKTTNSNVVHGNDEKMIITSLVWSPGNPFELGALLSDGALVAWRLTSSDIAARRVEAVANTCVTSSDCLALITPENEVQVHRLKSEVKDNIELFKKYTSLL